MGADAYAVCMDDHRIMRIDRMFAGFGHGVHRVKNVFPVTVDDTQVLEAGEVVGYLAVGRLVLFGDGDTVAVILQDEDNGELFVARPVDGFIDVTFGSGGLAMRSDRDTFMVVINHCTGDTYGMQVVCPGCRGYVLDVPLRLGEVVGHMPSAAGRVGRFRDTVQDNFFRRHSGREDRQHIAVIRKEIILSPVEYLSDGKLDAVMPGIRGMIGPS